MKYSTVDGIRKFHCFKFAGNHQNAFACESPEIIYEKDSKYVWKEVKIPAIKSALPLKRKSAP